MALKDWKKIRKDTWALKGHYPEDAGSGVITIGKDPNKKGYLFVESKNIWHPKHFKTKSKALTFAKKYMRSH